MKRIQVQSFEHLDELLRQGYSQFTAINHGISFSREITFSDDQDRPYEIFSYVSSVATKYSRERLKEYLGMVNGGYLYAEW